MSIRSFGIASIAAAAISVCSAAGSAEYKSEDSLREQINEAVGEALRGIGVTPDEYLIQVEVTELKSRRQISQAIGLTSSNDPNDGCEARIPAPDEIVHFGAGWTRYVFCDTPSRTHIQRDVWQISAPGDISFSTAAYPCTILNPNHPLRLLLCS